MSTAPRPTLRPSQNRLLHAGPRARVLEVMLVLHIVLAFVGSFVGWQRFQAGFPLQGLGLALLTLLPLVVDARRFQRLTRLKALARYGFITYGQVVGRRKARAAVAPRADGLLPGAGQPWRPILEVTYSFQDERGSQFVGSFVTSVRDRKIYQNGHPIEVFFDDRNPRLHAPSIVLRWYWRIGLAPRFIDAGDETVPFEKNAHSEDSRPSS